MQNKQVYARVINGAIVEYPVYEEYVIARGNPMNWYTPVQQSSMPAVGPYQSLASTPTVIGSMVVLQYTVQNMSFETLLNKVWGVPNLMQLNNTPGATMPPTPLVGSIATTLLTALEDSASARLQTTLDAFAQTAGYNSIVSACSYFNSTNTVYAAQAKTAMTLRDASWAAIESYIAGIKAGTIPVPSSFQPIQAALPVLVW